MTAPTIRNSVTRRLFGDRMLHRGLARTLLTPHPVEHYVRSLGVTWSDDPTGATVVMVDRPVADVTVLTLRLPAGIRRPAPGGALEIGVVADGVVHRRHYSPVDAASSTDRLATIAVRRHPGGVVSEYLWAEAAPGMRLLLGGAAGEMSLPETRPADVLLVSGGSGMTPMLSIASTLAAEGHCRERARDTGPDRTPGTGADCTPDTGSDSTSGTGPDSTPDTDTAAVGHGQATAADRTGRVAWIHYARRVEDVPFRRQLRELSRAGIDVHVIPTADVTADDAADFPGGRTDRSAPGVPDEDRAITPDGLTGYLTAAHLEAAAPWHAEATIFLCGPEGLADGLETALGAKRFADVLRERFTATVAEVPDTDGGTVTHLTSGVTADNPGTTLLEGAEAAGLRPQHGCRMGICHTCTAVRVSGATRDLRTGEVDSEPGCRVQICVSAPVGDVEIEL